MTPYSLVSCNKWFTISLPDDLLGLVLKVLTFLLKYLEKMQVLLPNFHNQDRYYLAIGFSVCIWFHVHGKNWTVESHHFPIFIWKKNYSIPIVHTTSIYIIIPLGDLKKKQHWRLRAEAAQPNELRAGSQSWIPPRGLMQKHLPCRSTLAKNKFNHALTPPKRVKRCQSIGIREFRSNNKVGIPEIAKTLLKYH